MGGIRNGTPDDEEKVRDRSAEGVCCGDGAFCCGDGAFFCGHRGSLCEWLVAVFFIGFLVFIALLPAIVT